MSESVGIRLSFSVGKSANAVVDMQVPGGKVNEGFEIARRLIAREDVPVWLELPILRVVGVLLAEDAAADVVARSADAKRDPARRSQGAREWAVAYKTESLRWNVPPSPSPSQPPPASVAQDEPKKEAGATREEREMFEAVVEDSKESRDALVGLEDSFAVGLAVMRDGRRFAVEKTHERQAEEMETEVKKNGRPESLSLLVARHVRELDEMEQVWDAKESAMISQQAAEYWDFVRELYDLKIRGTAAGQMQEPSSPTPPSTPARQHDVPPSSSPAAAVAGVKSLTKKLFQKVTGAPAPPAAAAAAASFSPSRQQVQSDAIKRESLSLLIGQGQLKTLYRIDAVRTALIPGLCEASCGTGSAIQGSRRERTMRRLYSRSLLGLVLPTTTPPAKDAKHREVGWDPLFRAQSTMTHDFHFGSLRQQLAPLIEASAAPLKPGDVFITRHSNLLDTHIVFHLVVDRTDNVIENNTKTSSTTLQGIWSILSLASQYDVSEVTIPIPVIPSSIPEDPETDQEALYLRHTEVFIRNIKAFLSATSPEAIKRITLVFPPNSPESVLVKFKQLI